MGPGTRKSNSQKPGEGARNQHRDWDAFCNDVVSAVAVSRRKNQGRRCVQRGRGEQIGLKSQRCRKRGEQRVERRRRTNQRNMLFSGSAEQKSAPGSSKRSVLLCGSLRFSCSGRRRQKNMIHLVVLFNQRR